MSFTLNAVPNEIDHSQILSDFSKSKYYDSSTDKEMLFSTETSLWTLQTKDFLFAIRTKERPNKQFTNFLF